MKIRVQWKTYIWHCSDARQWTSRCRVDPCCPSRNRCHRQNAFPDRYINRWHLGCRIWAAYVAKLRMWSAKTPARYGKKCRSDACFTSKNFIFLTFVSFISKCFCRTPSFQLHLTSLLFYGLFFQLQFDGSPSVTSILFLFACFFVFTSSSLRKSCFPPFFFTFASERFAWCRFSSFTSCFNFITFLNHGFELHMEFKQKCMCWTQFCTFSQTHKFQTLFLKYVVSHSFNVNTVVRAIVTFMLLQ